VEDLDGQQMFVKFVSWLLSDRQMQQEFLATKYMVVVLHTPHMPDLNPCDFSCFGEWNRSYGDIISRMFLRLGAFITILHTILRSQFSSASSSGRNAERVI
jgi:hypothetical protein